MSTRAQAICAWLAPVMAPMTAAMQAFAIGIVMLSDKRSDPTWTLDCDHGGSRNSCIAREIEQEQGSFRNLTPTPL